MSELTPEQTREHHLSRIREYATDRALSGEHIALMFQASIAAASQLRPGLVKSEAP